MTKKEREKFVITPTKKKKNIQKKRLTKEKKAKPDNLDDSQKEQLGKFEKEGKKAMRYNLDEEKKEH